MNLFRSVTLPRLQYITVPMLTIAPCCCVSGYGPPVPGAQGRDAPGRAHTGSHGGGRGSHPAWHHIQQVGMQN